MLINTLNRKTNRKSGLGNRISQKLKTHQKRAQTAMVN